MSERHGAAASGVRALDQRAGWVVIALAILGLSAFLAWEVPRISQVTAAHTDFIETVYGLRAFVAGGDPYGAAVAARVDALMAGHPVPPPPGGHYEHPFDYLLPPALVYLPVVALPDETAIIVVRALTVALYLVAWLALVWRFGTALPAAARALLVLLGLVWWPFLSVILPIVQQAGTIFALLALAGLAAERGRWGWAGAAAFLALLKPTESLPVVALLALWAWRAPVARRGFLAGFAAVGVPAALVAFARRPTWLADWLHAVLVLQAGHFAYMVDPLGPLAALTHLPRALIGGAAALAVGIWFWRAWLAAGRAASGDERAGTALWWWLGASCVLTLLVIPRTGTYDMVIALIPWCVALGAAGALPGTRRALAAVALCALLAAAGLLAYRDHAAFELPALALALVPALWLCRSSGALAAPTGGVEQAAVPVTAEARPV